MLLYYILLNKLLKKYFELGKTEMGKKVFLLTYVVLISCNIHKVKKSNYTPSFPIENKFSVTQKFSTKNSTIWYKNFKNLELEKLIQEAFKNNFNLKSVWSRLKQAQLKAQQAGVDLRPKIDLSTTISQNSNTLNENVSVNIGGNLSWEIDIWEKVKNLQAIELADIREKESIYQNTALVLSAAIANNYFDLQTKIQLQEVLKKRIIINKKIYNYIAYRKTITGVGNLVDYQEAKAFLLQEQDNLAKNKLDIQNLQQSIAILIGKSPISYKFIPKIKKQNLPQLPQLPSPKDLINSNANIKQNWQRISKKDHNIAIKFASRFPTLKISSSYALLSNERFIPSPKDFILNLSLSLVKSIYDGGKSEVNHKISKEELLETIHDFNQTYLETLKNIEEALKNEKYLIQSYEYQKARLEIAEKNTKEIQFLYSNASNANFQSILTQISSANNNAQVTINTKNRVLKARVALHLALGYYVIKKRNK